MSLLREHFKSWRGYLNEQLLSESRFTTALDYAQNFKKAGKQYRVGDVFEQMTDEQVQLIKTGVESAIELAKSYDPSVDNKYLMWIARNLRKDLGRTLQKYSKHWNTTPVPWDEKAAADDPAQVPFDADEKARGIGARLYNTVEGLQHHITNYHTLKQRNIITKDIYDFDPTTETGEFRNYVEGAMQILRDKEAKEELKQQAKGESDELLQAEDYAVVRPNSERASCLHGWGTRWCISSRESRNYFNQYSGEGKVFYFLMFRHLSNTNSPNKKMALVYGREQTHGDDPEQVFDALDDEVQAPGLSDGITENLLTKVMKQVEAFKGERETMKKMVDTDRYDKQQDLRDWIARAIESPSESENKELALQIGKALFPDVYAEEIDLDISDLQEKFEELVQEQYSEIVDNASYHAEQNPGGPKYEDYEKLYDQYKFDHVYVSYDEYDTNAWYWDGGYAIETADEHFADLKLPEDVDLDEFSTVVNDALSDSGMYPDETDGDSYDNAVRIRFTPDDDESQGLDGFERFLDRMHEYDEMLGGEGFWDVLAEKLMEAGLTGGGLKELEDALDEIEFENLEYGREGKEFNITLEIDPVLARPKGISGLYFGRMINAFAGSTLSGPHVSDPEVGNPPGVGLAKGKILSSLISAETVNKIEDAIRNKYNAIWDQMDLPGFERDEREAKEIDTLPMIDMAFWARPDQITVHKKNPIFTDVTPFATKERDKGAGGANIEYPYNFVLTLTNEQYWESIGTDEGELQVLITFLKWIDQNAVKNQIEALHQETLNNTVLRYMKQYPQRTEKDLEDEGKPGYEADVEDKVAKARAQMRFPAAKPESEEGQTPGELDEPQVAEQKLNELYKRWAKMIK